MNTQHCACVVIEGRWISACVRHEAQYMELQRRAIQNYEQYRRNAYVPPVREGSSCH